MNKKAEFSWGLFAICMIVGFLLFGGIYLGVKQSMDEIDRFERLCEKKGMNTLIIM